MTDPTSLGFTQSEANELFEGPPFDMSYGYSARLLSVAMGLFFTPIVPVALLLSILTILITDIVERVLLARRHKMPRSTGLLLGYMIYWVYDLTFIAFAVCLLIT